MRGSCSRRWGMRLRGGLPRIPLGERGSSGRLPSPAGFAGLSPRGRGESFALLAESSGRHVRRAGLDAGPALRLEVRVVEQDLPVAHGEDRAKRRGVAGVLIV